jgi:adenylate cyclase
MADEGFKRKLTAILSADVIGYSRLMRDNEEATVRDLAARRVLISDIIQQHHGRVVDSPGDNILAEFASVVDAVNSAIKIQEEIKRTNADSPQDRRMEFRIGINLGDVIEEKERIYGDGVNIAARVEGLAAGGGIAISGTVYEHIKEKLSLGYHYLGEQEVKNISEPVRVYRLLTEPADVGKMIGERKPKSKKLIWAAFGAISVIILVVGIFAIWNYYFRPSFEPASVENMAYPLPDKPSIAVLPFDNMSEDPKQEFFSDGITEDIITALSKTPRLFVIARNSTFTYKKKPVKIQQVAEELGVRYILEGSVRKSENKVRITAQLIDALKGTHLWAEKYDRDLKDIFAIQDSITREIITALQVELTEGEQARIWSRGTLNVKAQQKAFESLEHFRRFNLDDVILCRKKAEEALALDPNYPFAYVLLAWSHLIEVWEGWSESPEKSMEKAVELGKKTLELDQYYADAHALLGSIYLVQRQWDKAIEAGQRAVALLPSGADVNGLLGVTLFSVGRPQEAISMFEKAIRLNPTTPNWLYYNLGEAQILAGDYQEAIASLRRVIQKNPKFNPARFHLIAAYSLSDQDEKAKAQIKEYLKLMPGMTIESWQKRSSLKNETDIDIIANALRKVGFPEHPPLILPDKPSIAVLPFDNLSKDAEQEYFADGMIDDLITDLSKISGLFVIARNSTFQYKGKAVDVKEVSRELGIRYVLEGSVRKAGDKVRINAQLIDATTGGHLWAERYDGQMEDIFSLQDKITQKIVAALAVKLTSGEKENIASKGTDNIEAYDAFLKGWQHYLQGTPDSFAKAISDFDKAVELDPNYGRAYAALALIHLKAGGSKEWYKALRTDYFTLRVKARHFLNIALKNPTALVYRVAASMELRRRNHEKAVQNAEKAITLNPTDAESQFAMAEVLVYSGRPKEAMKIINAVMRLDPNKMADCLRLIGIAHFWLEEYKEAIASFNRSLKYNPSSWVHDWLASAYANMGNDNDARAAFEIEKKRWLQVSGKGETATITKLDLQPTVYSQPFKNADVTRRFVDGLIKSGWPEPHRYYEVHKENKLTGKEVRNLVKGRTQVLAGFAGGGWTQNFGKDGKVNYQGFGIQDTGKYWIEGDQCCVTYDKMMARLPLCVDMYRNPSGTVEKKDEYIQVNDFGMYPISYMD